MDPPTCATRGHGAVDTQLGSTARLPESMRTGNKVYHSSFGYTISRENLCSIASRTYLIIQVWPAQLIRFSRYMYHDVGHSSTYEIHGNWMFSSPILELRLNSELDNDWRDWNTVFVVSYVV